MELLLIPEGKDFNCALSVTLGEPTYILSFLVGSSPSKHSFHNSG